MRLFLLALSLALSGPGHTQILKLVELNTTQIQALDRARTVILIPNGLVEEHGPYLPTFTDGYLDEALIPQILDGKLDPATLPRYGDLVTDQATEVETPLLAHQAEIARKQAQWLTTQPLTAPKP